jgi:RNA polymerase sigma factor (sigma-70 family)
VQTQGVEGLLRQLAPETLGVLLRRHGQFDACEDAVQEALLAAAMQWPSEGVPDHPRAWLITVASRRLTDAWRSDHARRDREDADFAAHPASDLSAPPPEDEAGGGDDTLSLLFLCCHPSLSPSSQLALTLRAVGGLTTTEIARAFLVPDATMGQRISRAKATIKDAGGSFSMPPAEQRDARLKVVLHVLYVIFNEGYTATSGPSLQRRDLATEAIRLTRLVHRLLPDDGEVAGLLALMLLTEARHAARTGPDGSLVPVGRAGPLALARRPDPRGRRARRRHPPACPPRAVPAPGRDRRRSRGRCHARRDRLAAGTRALRPPRACGAQPDGHAEPSRRARDGPRP